MPEAQGLGRGIRGIGTRRPPRRLWIAPLLAAVLPLSPAHAPSPQASAVEASLGGPGLPLASGGMPVRTTVHSTETAEIGESGGAWRATEHSGW